MKRCEAKVALEETKGNVGCPLGRGPGQGHALPGHTSARTEPQEGRGLARDHLSLASLHDFDSIPLVPRAHHLGYCSPSPLKHGTFAVSSLRHPQNVGLHAASLILRHLKYGTLAITSSPKLLKID